MKNLLMLDATFNAIPLILSARKMGYYVITVGNFKDRPGVRYADKHICADYSDIDLMINICVKYDIVAISCGTSDPASYITAILCDKLGLKGHDTLQSIETLHLKDKFKEFTRIHNIKSPLSVNFSSEKEALSYLHKVNFPVIIKPIDQAGGKGVQVVYNEAEFKNAVRIAFTKSVRKKILVEEYITGTLHSFTTFLHDQHVVSFCNYDDYSYVNKYMTNSGTAPASHVNNEKICNFLVSEIEKIASILSLVDGLFHMQYIVNEKGVPYIIEIMRRCPGNWSTSIGSISLGLQIEDWFIRAECGESCKFLPNRNKQIGYYAYHTIMGDRNGIYDGLAVSSEVKENIFQFVEIEQKGHEITDYLYDKLGVVFLQFTSHGEMLSKIKKINELIKVNIV